jgi:HptB-dependent secretion and biofilm anti anti-sigma factor
MQNDTHVNHKQKLSSMTPEELTDLVDRDFNQLWLQYMNRDTDRNIINSKSNAFTATKSSLGAVITINSDQFTFKHQDEFRNSYSNFPQHTMYVIDFKSVQYIDSVAMGMLLLMREFNGDNSTLIRFTNCNESIMKILQMAKFDRLFACHKQIAAQ